MADLEDILRDNMILNRDGIDDVGSNAAPVTITDAAGFVEYVNPGGGYEDGNISLWNKTTNTLDCSQLPAYNKIELILRSTINVTDINAIVTVKFVIPDPGGEIIVDELDIVPAKKNVDYIERAVFNGYAGASAVTHGIKAYTKVSSGSVTVSNRTLLVRV